MNKINDQDIERYVRYRHELSKDECKQIEEAIKNSSLLSELKHWYESFYSTFDMLSRPSSIILNTVREEFEQNDPLVFAAKTVESNAFGLHTLATYMLEEANTIVRILKKLPSNTVQIHVISSHLSPNQRVILKWDQSDYYLVTELGGKLSGLNSDSFENVDWNNSSLQIFLPKHTLLAVEMKDLEKIFKIKNTKSDSLLLIPNDKKLNKIVIDKGEESELLLKEEGAFYFKWDKSKNINVFLYR